MAKDNDKGLFLPLKINLSEWEKSLTQADADLQKAMREMRSSVKDLKLQYDVKIAGAKAAGNELKAIELENQKLNQIYETQRRAVEALNRAYEKSVREKGADAKATQALATQLVAQTKEMERAKAQLDATGINFGKKISDSLASVSPEFAKIREGVKSVTGSLSGLGTAGAVAAKAIGGIGIAAAGIAAVASGLDAITNNVNEIAKAGVNASDPIYQLRESLQSTYEDAEFLFRVTKVDGSNAESLTNSLVKLDAALLKDADGTSAASQALAKYGAQLLNADGSVKSYREQLQELAKAAQFAASIGEYGDFKAALPGAFRSTEFDHLLLGLEDYIKLADNASAKTEVYYDKLHELTNKTNALALAQQELDAVKGGFYADSALKNLQNEINTQKAVTLILKENEKEYGKISGELGNITNEWTNFKGTATIAWESIKADIAGGIGKLKEFNNEIKDSILFKGLSLFGGSGAVIADKLGITDYLTNKLNEAKTKLETKKTDISTDNQQKQTEQEEKDRAQRMANYKAQLEKQKQKENEATLKKQAEAEKQFYRELRDLRATEYQKEIYHLEDRKQAWIDSGIAIVDAEKRFSEEKALIDKKYYEKQQAEREKNLKATEAAYAKEAEAAKKARESAITEAESTLKNNIKLLKYIQNEQKKGTYTDENARAYAEKLYFKQNGFNQGNVDFLKSFGLDKLKEIADVRNRVFSQFGNMVTPPATNITNNFNFDNTVVEDAGAMDMLANKVADIITPAIKQAINGNNYQY